LDETTEPVELLRAEVAEIRRAAAELDATAQALRESRQRIRQLVHQCPIAVIEFDPDFCVVEWNAAAERIFGHSRDEMLGKHARILIPESVQPLVDRIWEDLLAQEGGARSRNENLTASGETIVCEWYNGPRLDDQGRVAGVISLAQDVTELVRVEAERRRLERRMVESAKLESLGVLAGGIAHDFNNLLVGIVGATGLALQALPSDSAARQHLDLVAKSADRAAELTRQMLAYSGKGRFVVEPVEVGALVEEMARLVQASITRPTQSPRAAARSWSPPEPSPSRWSRCARRGSRTSCPRGTMRSSR
jgi:PAS domain S-box-containing protein